MSGALSAQLATSDTSPVYLRFYRSLAGLIVPDCVIEEVGRDDLQITEHPVEFGSVIADHAYKRPREVTLRWAWSNSDPRHPSETFVLDVYNYLLAIQLAREPFALYTGKSNYTNMLIYSLGQTTNASSEYTLMTVIVCREVIITYTEAAPPPQSSQAVPSVTSPNLSSGSKQLITQPNDIGDPVTAKTQFPSAVV